MTQRNPEKPNVILVLTDDQGYADLGCTGNPWLRTPHIDAFSREAVRCHDFHVSPLCTPTRGALLTGHRPIRNGAWATAWGRSMLRREELTLGDLFAANGYATGMFGKWHVGDNYPYRPQDRGFQRVVAHKGGGVGQTPDFWGNKYFDDTYFHNGTPVPHTGYCTDIWFDEAMKFIEEFRDRPFFVYLATNAPHSPYWVAERYTDPYRNNPDIPEPAFYGMIANIDENFGRLRAHLRRLGIERDTLLIFMTDNGSSGGCDVDARQFPTRGYNAGMRGKKGSFYDGGHRAPFFIRWPGGSIANRDVDALTDHVDVAPTLVDLCGLALPRPIRFDGISLAGLLTGAERALPERTHFVQCHQSHRPPEMWANTVMTSRWRLYYGRELYDIRNDPGQRHDVSASFPEVVRQLRAAHEAWWAEVAPGLEKPCPQVLGNDAENPVRLDAADVMGDIAWDQPYVREAVRSSGKWFVQVERAGRYRFSLRRWPEELGLPMDAVPTGRDGPGEVNSVEVNTRHGSRGRNVALGIRQAQLKIGGFDLTVPVAAGDREAVFEANLEPLEGTLEAWFFEQNGERRGAYYVYVTRRP